MRPFWIVDLNAAGEQVLKERYEYAQLERLPGAAELLGDISSWLWRSFDEFEAPLLGPQPGSLTLRWRACAPSAGIGTLRWRGEVCSLTLLASGLDPAADATTLGAFQRHLVRELHDTGIEPAFALLGQPERPLAATVNLRAPQEARDRQTFVIADRCLAASYFRRLGLC